MNKIFKIIIIFILFAGFFIVIHNINWSSRIEITNELKIFGLVEDIISERGLVILKLNTNDNEYFFPTSYNYDYNPFRIDDFLKINDSIEKPINSDTLFVFKNKVKYYFIIGNTDLNRP